MLPWKVWLWVYLPTETRELSNSLHQLPWSLSPGTVAREAHVVPVNLGCRHFLKPWLTSTRRGEGWVRRLEHRGEKQNFKTGQHETRKLLRERRLFTIRR